MRPLLVLCVLVVLWVSTPAHADITSNLIACWGLNEGTGGGGATTADSSGNGNTCTLGSGTETPTWIAGQVGAGALSFDGGDRLTCGTGASLAPTNAITIAMRIWATTATVVGIALAKPVAVDAGQDYMLQWRSNQRIRFTGVGIPTVDSATNLTAATWYSAVGVYNRTDARMYINGVLDSTPVAGTAAIGTSGQALRIGVGHNTSEIYFNGRLDDIRLWSRALTASDVAEYHVNTVACGAAAAAPPRRRPILLQSRGRWYATLVPGALRPALLGQ